MLLASVDWVPVVLAGVLAFAEAALGLGAVFPGEVAIVALATSFDTASTVAAMVLVALGACLGDHVGYALGRRFGPQLADSRLIRRVGADKWAVATELICRYGVPALLVSRLLPVVRTVMPAVAGASRLRYRSFLLASVVGSIIWALLWVGAGGVLDRTDLLASPAGVLVAAGVVAGVLLGVRRVVRRLETLDRVHEQDDVSDRRASAQPVG